MIKALLIGLLLLSGCFLGGCSSMKPADLESATPRFRMEEYFLGKTKGYGQFYDRFGAVKSRFTIELEGFWREDKLILQEVLRYESGEILNRDYEITKIDEHHYEGSTEDVVGVARIESRGNALRWKYRLKQDIGGSVWVLTFDDWMFLQEDGVVLNRAYVSKWGFRVGEVFMAIRKLE